MRLDNGKHTGHTITSDSALGSAVIKRSLRFNRGDAPYLQTTLGNSNVDKWTWSGWVKKTIDGQHQNLFSSGSDNVVTMINFDNNDYLKFQNWHSGQRGTKITNRKFRDNSAWMHIVAIWDSGNSTADDRIRLYVNGTRETSFSSSSNPDQNQDSVINGNTLGGSDYGEGKHFIGRYADLTDPSGTYKTEIHFIDGYAYDPSYFGFTDPVTNIWTPKRYEGTYGTNGFYLDFSDNSSTTTLGIDKSPNGNDFTASNFSVSAGAGNDSLEDTPTNNFCTLNPLQKDSNTTLSEGNLKAAGSSSTDYNTNTRGTFSFSSGKWYYEAVCDSTGVSNGLSMVGWVKTSIRFSDNPTGGSGVGYRPNKGDYVDFTADNTTGKPTTSTGTVIQIAIDFDAGKIWFGSGGTYFESGDPSTGLNAARTFTAGTEMAPVVRTLSATYTFNFGQRPFSYTVPTGFKTIESRNLPLTVPSITKPQRHFECVTFTGNGSTGQSITSLEFQPDFIWFKNRSAGNNHASVNSVLGRSKGLYMDSNSGDFNSSAGRDLVSFDPSGFTVGEPEQASSTNNNGSNIVAWCWKAGGSSNTFNIDGKGYASASAAGLDDGSINPTGASVNTESGFSILTYTGTGSNATIGHGLGKAPKLIWVKLRGSQDWFVNNGMIFNDYGKYYKLNSSGSSNASDTNVFPNTAPTSTVFSVGTDNAVNGNGDNYVAYIWSEIPGFSQFGYWTGNGSSDGTYVHTGFTPRMMIYRKASDENWHMLDTQRDPLNPNSLGIDPNLSNAESDDSNIQIDFLGSGFKMRASHGTSNADGTNYFYYVWAGQPGTTPFGTHPNAR